MSNNQNFEDQRTQFQVAIEESFQSNNVNHLVELFQHSTIDEADRKGAMDQAFRDHLLKILSNKLDILQSYISFCIECCRKQTITATMPVVLLGDIFDAFTIDKCEHMFSYVEDAVNIWKEDLFFVACKNNLLRMCNDLLRRLSRSQNTVFCGRILLFLAKVFPFSERSGLNIVSEFNLDNLTEFGCDNSTNLKESLENEKESIVADSKNKLLIDYNLYCKFWALQDYFRNPNSCYNKVQWKVFTSHASNVLSAFSSYKLEALQLKSKKRPLGSDEPMESSVKEQHYFAKFLTNQKLLELQLSDSNFRRCVLVQFLILFQYLNSPVKFKTDTHELKSDQLDWIKDTTDLIYKLISETPPDGKLFCDCVRHILKREEHWNNWKNDGCPEFQKAKPVTEQPPPEESPRKVTRARRTRPLGDIVEDYESQGKFFMGSSELTKLWNLCPDNLEACKSKDRDFMPSLESYFAEAIECLEGGSRPPQISDSDWGWRALRLLAHKSPHFFMHSNTPIGRLPDYLDTMVKRIARELPSVNGVLGNNTPDNGSTSNSAGDGVSASDGDAKKKGSVTDEPAIKDDEDQADTVEIKTEDANDIDQMPDSTLCSNYDEGGTRSQVHMITVPHIEMLSKLLTADWKTLAAKLGFRPDEILHFDTENLLDSAKAKNMLIVWSEDEDSTVENLIYILEGLHLDKAAEFLKDTVASNDI